MKKKPTSVEAVLEGKEINLIQTCFFSVFLLPPKEEMWDLRPYLYFMTLKAMDTMLVALVLNSSASRVSMLLQNIFQMLLTFTTSKRVSVQERAVGRMRVLTFLLANYSSLKFFEEYLQSSERTDMVLVFIEAMTDSSTFDKEVARNMLDMVMGNPDFWLEDVPKIMSYIQKTLGYINTAPGQQSVDALLLLMTKKWPWEVEVVMTLLNITPRGDSSVPGENGPDLQLVLQTGTNGTKLICTVKYAVMKAWPV